MATGFTVADGKTVAASVARLLLLLLSFDVCASEIGVSALFNGKALITIDGGKPMMLSVGQMSPEGVKLVSATSEAAVIEYKGGRQTLSTETSTRVATAPVAASSAQTTLKADGRGHFYAEGWINGGSVRFLVDTGATTIALSTAEARRLGIDYARGTRSNSRTANGNVAGYSVKLDSVRIGEITLQNVEAHVLETTGLSTVLLGMSFLNRTQMQRDGETLVLTKRF